MLTSSQLVIILAVFSFMATVVQMLPPIVRGLQTRYKDRLGSMTREMDKFFVHMKATHIVVISLGVGGLIGALLESWVVGVTLALFGIFTPRLLLSIWKSVRSAQFDLQLMDALVLINNALRSGLDIATGIELVATNLKPPISEEFNLVLNAYRLGTSLEGALVDMTRRIRSRTLETTISAIIIQRETGGNLVKTFDQLINTIREESTLQKKVKAFSAQGRTQVMFLAVFPWALAVGFYFLSPDVVKPALQDPWGQGTLIGLVVWEIIGLLVTKQIVTVDV